MYSNLIIKYNTTFFYKKKKKNENSHSHTIQTRKWRSSLKSLVSKRFYTYVFTIWISPDGPNIIGRYIEGTKLFLRSCVVASY